MNKINTKNVRSGTAAQIRLASDFFPNKIAVVNNIYLMFDVVFFSTRLVCKG